MEQNNKKTYAIIGVIALVIAVLVGYNWYVSNNPDSALALNSNTNTATVSTGSNASTNTAPKSEVISANRTQSVAINVAKPVSGTRKGVIELGASGFNAFVAEVDNQNRWQLVSKEFGVSLAYEGLATEQDVMSGMKTFLAQMVNRGVNNRNLHFVISSGALKEPKTKVIANGIRKAGYVVNEVTAEQEGRLGFLATLPQEYHRNGFVVDLGSGNTKISWMENGKVQSVEASGSKYFQNNISDQAVLEEMQRNLAKIPQANREYCFMIGGVPFQLASKGRNGDERYTVLKSPNEYTKTDDFKFNSGLNIYQGLYVPNTKYVFDWDSNFTIGFLLSLKN